MRIGKQGLPEITSRPPAPAMQPPREIAYTPSLPEHCTQCGEKMVMGKKKRAVGAYDRDTGKDTGAIEYPLQCVKLTTWWGKLGLTGYHNNFLVVEHPHGFFHGEPTRSILEVVSRI